MPISQIVAGDAQVRSWVSKTKLTLEPNWIVSLLGLVEDGYYLTVGCTVQSLNTKHNCTYITKLHRHTLSPLSLSLTHVKCKSNNPLCHFSLPSTELRDYIHPGSMSPHM